MYSHYKTTISSIDLITLVSLGSIPIVKQKLLEGWDPNVQNEDGTSPVLKAAGRNDLEMLKLLIQAGARVDIAGFTQLKLANMNENQEMIQVIIENNKHLRLQLKN